MVSLRFALRWRFCVLSPLFQNHLAVDVIVAIRRLLERQTRLLRIRERKLRTIREQKGHSP